MAAGFTVAIASETKAFRQGVEGGIIEPLENAEETLQDLARDRSLNQLEDKLEDAQKASQKLERETKETAKAIEQEFRDSYRALKQNADAGYSSAGEAAQSFKDEAKQNFAETASSFDGSMDSIADMAQSTLGGLATSISGPLGITLGAVAAVAGAAFARISAESEAMEERVTAAFEQMVENGSREITALQENQRIAEVISEDWEKIQRISDLTGAPVERVARALALGGESANGIVSALNELQMDRRSGEVQGFINDLERSAKASEAAEEMFNAYTAATARGAAEQGRRLDGLAQKLEALDREITTTVKLDTSHLDRELARPRSMNVRINPVDQYGRRVV